ncbi:MAG: hypothetical protein AAGD22_12435 [Verrucomicrobiota bacterium]
MNPQDEERITQWIDGTLSDTDVQDLLETHPELHEAKSQSESLGKLLRKELDSGEQIPYPDFFNHQLKKRIEEEDAESPSAAADQKDALAESMFPRFMFFKKMAPLAALAVIGLFIALLFFNVPVGGSKIVSTYTPNPALEAKIFYSDEAGATVLLIEGLADIPAQQNITGVQAVGYAPDADASHLTLYSTQNKPILALTVDRKAQPRIRKLSF